MSQGQGVEVKVVMYCKGSDEKMCATAEVPREDVLPGRRHERKKCPPRQRQGRKSECQGQESDRMKDYHGQGAEERICATEKPPTKKSVPRQRGRRKKVYRGEGAEGKMRARTKRQKEKMCDRSSAPKKGLCDGQRAEGKKCWSRAKALKMKICFTARASEKKCGPPTKHRQPKFCFVAKARYLAL